MELKYRNLTREIIGKIIRVHQALGPGFLEKVYQKALIFELERSSLRVETEKEVVIRYEDQEVGRHRLDLLVEGKVIVELKTVENLSHAHYAQIRSYLKATGLKIGLLVNLSSVMADFRRIEL